MARAVGVAGHQSRQGIRWDWVRKAVREEIVRFDASRALSSLAAGSDQVFADEAQRLGLTVIAVVPVPNYERFFKGDVLVEYRRLLERSKVVQLPGSPDEHRAFFDAGSYISDHSDLMLAVWDEKPSKGFGGTADVVNYRLSSGRPTVILNPITLHRKECF